MGRSMWGGSIDFLTTLAGTSTGNSAASGFWAWAMPAVCSPLTAPPATMMKPWCRASTRWAAEGGYTWKLRDLLPQVLSAGEDAGCLTEEGAKLLDVSGNLQAGIPMCPPEGDAGTGMAATNAVAERTGNVSAGTSIFAMIVLEKGTVQGLSGDRYGPLPPTASPWPWSTANNCTNEINAWAKLFAQFRRPWARRWT